MGKILSYIICILFFLSISSGFKAKSNYIMRCVHKLSKATSLFGKRQWVEDLKLRMNHE